MFILYIYSYLLYLMFLFYFFLLFSSLYMFIFIYFIIFYFIFFIFLFFYFSFLFQYPKSLHDTQWLTSPYKVTSINLKAFFPSDCLIHRQIMLREKGEKQIILKNVINATQDRISWRRIKLRETRESL